MPSGSTTPTTPVTPTTPATARKENVWRSVFHPGSNLATKGIGAQMFDKPVHPNSPTVYDWYVHNPSFHLLVYNLLSWNNRCSVWLPSKLFMVQVSSFNFSLAVSVYSDDIQVHSFFCLNKAYNFYFLDMIQFKRKENVKV